MLEDTKAKPATGEPSTPLSFRERKEQELRQEHSTEGQPEETIPSPGSKQDETDQRQPGDELPEESEDQPEGEESEGALDEAVEETEEPQPDERETQWQAKIDAAEEGRKSMEVDYRRKTHKLSEHARDVESKATEVEATAQYYAQQAEHALQQFNGINWAQLRTNPEQYQQAQQAYMQASQAVETRKAELAQVSKRREEMAAESQRHIAEHSKGVLQHQIPGWGNEVYSKLRDFAGKTYDFSAEEFDKIVDWRTIKMLHDAMQIGEIKSETGKVLKAVGQKRGNSAPGKNSARQAPRNARGQYLAAREKSMSNPGDKSAFREMKSLQLMAERDRGRR